VLGQVVPRHVAELAAPVEELAEERVRDVLEDLLGIERS